jgi:ribosomal protein L3
MQVDVDVHVVMIRGAVAGQDAVVIVWSDFAWGSWY